MSDGFRLLPKSVDAEHGMIASMLLDPKENCGLCAERGVTVEYFHIPANGILFTAIMEMWHARKPIDFILLTRKLDDAGLLDHVGGASNVTELFTFLPTAANAAYYLEILREKWELRKIIQKYGGIIDRCYDDQSQIEEIRNEAQSALLEITSTSGMEAKARTMRENYHSAIDRMNAISEGTAPAGLMTGLRSLDRKLGGFHNGEVTVISGTTGGGKTSLAHNIADYVAIGLKRAVLLFSYEMPSLWVTNRIIAARARVDTEAIRTGKFTNDEFNRMNAAGNDIIDAPIWIEDNPDMTLDMLRTRARRRKATDDIALIIVDYIQKIPHSGNKNGSRQREVAEISDGLQKMAMELDVPVVALSQLNEEGQVREARDIAFDAKTVLKITRNEKIAVESEPDEVPRGIVICKNNNGSVGKVPVMFLKTFVKFADMHPDQEKKWYDDQE